MPEKTITLLALTSRNVSQHVAAINATMEALRRPCDRLIICPEKPNVDNRFRWENHPIFLDWKYPESYNRFMLKLLADFIHTDFVITIHDDGYGRNGDRWINDFLSYDYIGAPWPSEWELGGYRVGNGGFSLRSRQLIELCRDGPEVDAKVPEDVHICRNHRTFFDQHKCFFAPVELAIEFSIEYGLSEYPGRTGSSSFGFHGKHNLNQAFSPPGCRGLQKTHRTLQSVTPSLHSTQTPICEQLANNLRTTCE